MSPSSPVMRSDHEFVVVWCKEQWNLPNINGQEPDITRKEFLNWTYSVWTIAQNNDKKINHPAIYPQELVKRLIKMYSYPGDIIMDNFNGSGTSTAVAKSLGRRWVGIEQNSTYCKWARERTEKASITD